MMSSVLASVRAIGYGLWRRLRRTGLVATPPYVGVIREAERCQADAERAAAFREANGLDRLVDAIEAAEADGYDKWIDRGRIAQRELTDAEPSSSRSLTPSSPRNR